MSSQLTSIFFDVGNTLLFPDRRIILAPLHERKLSPSLDQLHAIERRTKKEFDVIMREGKADHSFWYIFYSHLLEELRVQDDALRGRLRVFPPTGATFAQARVRFCKGFDAATRSA